MAAIQILTDTAAAVPVTGLKADLESLGHTVTIVTAGPYNFSSTDLIAYCVTNGSTVANSLAAAKASGKPMLLSVPIDGTTSVTTAAAQVALGLAVSVSGAVAQTSYARAVNADWISSPEVYSFGSYTIATSARKTTATGLVDNIWAFSPISGTTSASFTLDQTRTQAMLWLVPPDFGQSTAWIASWNVASNASSSAASVQGLRAVVAFLLAPASRTFTIKDEGGVDKPAIAEIYDKYGNQIGTSKTVVNGRITVPFITGNGGIYEPYQNIVFKTTDGAATNSAYVPRPV